MRHGEDEEEEEEEEELLLLLHELNNQPRTRGRDKEE